MFIRAGTPPHRRDSGNKRRQDRRESSERLVASCHSLHSFGVILPTGDRPHSMPACVNTCGRINPNVNAESGETCHYSAISGVFHLDFLYQNTSLTFQ